MCIVRQNWSRSEIRGVWSNSKRFIWVNMLRFLKDIVFTILGHVIQSVLNPKANIEPYNENRLQTRDFVVKRWTQPNGRRIFRSSKESKANCYSQAYLHYADFSLFLELGLLKHGPPIRIRIKSKFSTVQSNRIDLFFQILSFHQEIQSVSSVSLVIPKTTEPHITS
jgi:hypothetical protein